MKATLRIRRYNPDRSPNPWWQEFEIDASPGTVVLYALHDIQETQDGTLAYRYSCRGAICGSCAMRINGRAALACKTQIADLDATRPIVVEPLLNMPVVKDLVVDHDVFFRSIRSIFPWLTEKARPGMAPILPDPSLTAAEADQYLRSTDCIQCQACFSDCPKRLADPHFEGPATCLAMYKRVYHPQEPDAAARLREACRPGGVFDCDRHGNCVKVCPKDCRPMRAILMLQAKGKVPHG
jgi:succinate dehydrogenase / fumarate reductase, iron-sulfur subunit